MLENLILKKSKISGVAQNGSISADWILRVANSGLHYLWHFSINFGNSCACLAANFLKTPPTFFIGMVLKAVMDKIPKKSEIRNYAILNQPINLTFLEDEIFQLFSYLYGSKVPKWNFAHILLWKKAKNIRKTPKNTLFTAPWLRTTLLNDPVWYKSPIYSLLNLKILVPWYPKNLFAHQLFEWDEEWPIWW